MLCRDSSREIDGLITFCADKLKSEGFSGFHDIHVNWFSANAHPGKVYRDFCERTQRAIAPLNNLMDMITYNALYSAQHFFRFQYLLNLVREKSSRSPDQPVLLKVIDYGCGQGVASLALLEQFRFHRDVDIELHLVEPSVLALYAAKNYVEAVAQCLQGRIRVYSHACTIDRVPNSVFSDGSNILHLFSNVLDLAYRPEFNLSPLIEKISQMPGKHLCLGVSPNYSQGKVGFDQFYSCFPYAKNLLNTTSISARFPSIYDVPRIYGEPIVEVKGRVMALLINHKK